MKADRVFTRRSMGLDLRVWRVMLLLCVASLGLLSYRFIGSRKCTPINFSVKALSEHTDSIFASGESISFIASSASIEIRWDYGDNSAIESGQYVTHRYATAGTYTVTAATGANCEVARQISIAAATSRHSHDEFVPGEEIIGSSTAKIGTEEIFTCMVSAKDYEWSIPNHPDMLRTGSSVKFQFPTTGNYTVQVTLDHDRNKRFSKEVTVEAAAAKPSSIPEKIVPLIPDELKAPPTKKIADDIFASYLAKVVDKKMGVDDFDEYLCDRGDTKAFLNGNITTFTAVCEEISGKRKRKFFISKKRQIKITSAIMQRDKAGCVTMVTVNYE